MLLHHSDGYNSVAGERCGKVGSHSGSQDLRLVLGQTLGAVNQGLKRSRVGNLEMNELHKRFAKTFQTQNTTNEKLGLSIVLTFLFF